MYTTYTIGCKYKYTQTNTNAVYLTQIPILLCISVLLYTPTILTNTFPPLQECIAEMMCMCKCNWTKRYYCMGVYWNKVRLAIRTLALEHYVKLLKMVEILIYTYTHIFSLYLTGYHCKMLQNTKNEAIKPSFSCTPTSTNNSGKKKTKKKQQKKEQQQI